jgi:hypothetical protein
LRQGCHGGGDRLPEGGKIEHPVKDGDADGDYAVTATRQARRAGREGEKARGERPAEDLLDGLAAPTFDERGLAGRQTTDVICVHVDAYGPHTFGRKS